MSRCISSHGEYSAHELVDNRCSWCRVWQCPACGDDEPYPLDGDDHECTVIVPRESYPGWDTLLALWPTEPWEFGEVLCFAIANAFAGVGLSKDAEFIDDVARATLAHIERLGFKFDPAVDAMVLHDGSRRAAGELPRKYTATDYSRPTELQPRDL